MNLTKHIIEHIILGVSGAGGGSSQVSNYWAYQDFDSPFTTSLTLTQNENADTPQTLGSGIINSSAVITTTNGKTVYKNTTLLSTNKIFVSSQTGTSVSLNAIPSSGYSSIRIWFLIRGTRPEGSITAPKFVTKQRIEMMEASFVNQFGDILLGDIDFNSNKATNLPLPSSNGEPLIYGNDGEVYFYDTSRNKKLSIGKTNFVFGRNNSNISSSQYLRTINGMQTNQNSIRLPFNSTLIGMIVSSKNSGNVWSGQIRINRNSSAIASVGLTTGDTYKIDNTLNIDFNEGDLIQIYLNRTSGTIQYPFVQLFFRQRG